MRTLAGAVCVLTIILAADVPPRMPIPTDYANSITTRWLAKPVLESRMLDDAEDLAAWRLTDTEMARGTLALTRERKVTGSSAVRLTSPTTGNKPIPATRYWDATGATRVVNGEDWSDWNRLSFWIYPDLPGFRVVSLLIIFHNEGSERVPDVYGKMGMNYVILRNHQWNHVVWEIANLPRDKVTGVEFSYRVQGNEPGATGTVAFDIDKLELEKVVPDHYEGWNVAPGQIAYSHSGYQTGSPKSAIASGLDAREFVLLNVETGVPRLRKAVSEVSTRIGRFQVMDFSEVREQGTYIISAGGRSTRPFRIGTEVWKSSLWKAINFFYVQRCGFAVPGVHDVCHRDWVAVHGDRKIVINGGWHDAGDLSQGLGNTAESTYAMFSLAERLQATGEDPVLLERLIEEAKWGLDWILKTAFHDGYRPGFNTMDRWTNGILGDVDDMISKAGNSPGGNFSAAAAEAIAARVLSKSDPILAGYSLKQAVEDWGFAVQGIAGQKQVSTELAGHAILAGLELWQATGERQYSAKSLELAAGIVSSQQRTFLPGLTHPLTGFFYTGPDRSRILRNSHQGHEEGPVVALVRLCELFPDHPDWMKWYSAVTLYSDYFQKAMAQFTLPYGMLANSVFHDEEYKQQKGGGRGATPEAFREQVLNGVKVGDRHYVRLFPVWFEFRGNHGTVLTQTKAISAAAHLRGNFELAALAQQQLQWVMGRNPFVQSTMWGEGHDYAPQYSAMSGDIVGSLPVGIQTRGNRDVPYWPTENCHNWKEVWVFPVARWIWLMRDLAGPASVSGFVTDGSRDPVEFRETATGDVLRFDPATATSTFRAVVPEGRYEVKHGEAKRTLTILPGGAYSVDLRPGRQVDFTLSSRTAAGGAVTLTAVVEGSGRHTLTARTDNLVIEQPRRQLELKPGAPQKIVWQGKMAETGAPWFAVIVPDGDINQRQDATGALR